MVRTIFLLVAGCFLAFCAPLTAQDAVLGQIYGNGVHAYFAEDYLRAHQLFTEAIDGHSQDPRCYYFRGLALLKLGRPQDADLDFQQGARLESSSDRARAYNVARSLERVQGSDRSRLEQCRMQARVTVLQKSENERRLRYQESAKEQRDFLMRESDAAPAKAVEPTSEGAKPAEVPGEVVKPGTAEPAAVPANPFGPGDASKPATPVAPARR